MKAVYIGCICLCYSLFLIFISPKEKQNMFGFKSFQQHMHKDIWKWTNQCFGGLLLAGSVLYSVTALILEFRGNSMPAWLNISGLIYITIAFTLTECYGAYKRCREIKEKKE